MKHRAALLAALALPTAAPALEVQDADVKLGIVLQLQVRAERAWASDRDGGPYAIAEGAADTRPDTADAYLRRFRIGFAGSYQDSYRFRAVMRFDCADRAGDAAPSAGTGTVTTANGDPLNRAGQINQAYVERVFTGDGWSQSLRAGLDYAFFNGAAAVFPASSYVLPGDRATASQAFLDPRGVGVGYKFTGRLSGHPFTWGADIQNNQSDTSAAVTGNTGGTSSNQGGEGLCYTTRLQAVLADSQPGGHMKPVESFLGAPGSGVLVSVEAGINRDSHPSPTTRRNLKAEGAEVLVHHGPLTALGEVRFAQCATAADTPAASSNVAGRIALGQAAWAFPTARGCLEPALRLTRIDLDLAHPEAVNYGSMANAGSDYGASGMQVDLGLNWYLSGYADKLQVAYQHWRGEGGTASPATADVIRAQWGLFF